MTRGYKGTVLDLQTGLYAFFNGAYEVPAARLVRGLTCGGVVTTGVGKSGYAARKVASTFATYNIPGRFLHPTEAAHGEMGGAINDLLIWFSASGKTAELEPIVNFWSNAKRSVLGITCCREPELPSSYRILIPQIEEDVPVIVPILMQLAGDGLAREAAILNGWDPSQLRIIHPANR